MKLRITVPDSDGKHFMRGDLARLFLDDVDVSKYVSRLVLIVDAEEPISAEITLFATDVEVDLPVVLRQLKHEEENG